jgi:arylsulfatase A
MLLILALAGCAGLTAAESTLPARPNLVVILADDLGYGDVQTFNPERSRISTPHFDRLAREGMTFTDAHSASAVCTPTRYALLTGRYAWRTRLQRGVIDGFQEPLIAPDRLTLPALLRRAGYHSALIGKWHLGFTLDSGEIGRGKSPGTASAPVGARTHNGPLTRGFDYFYGVQHARSMGTFFEQDVAVAVVKPVDALGRLTQRAVEYVKERAGAGQPFFLYFALTSPHTPIVPSQGWRGKSGLGDYGDFVMETDWAIGQVLAALDEAGIAGRTLVLASSDNGCAPQARPDQLEAQGHFPSAQFRGYKADIWEGGHRVPFVVRWPGHVEPRTTNRAPICLTDLIATCAEIIGVKLPPNAAEDSFSFLPALQGQSSTGRRVLVHHSIHGKFAVREGSWKLALTAGSGGFSKEETSGPMQLYDLARDEAERHNLAAEQPAVVQRLTARLEQIVNNGRSTPGPRQRNDVPVAWRASDDK